MIPLLLALLPSPALACGPDLALALISAPPESLWVAPVADFDVELRALAPPARFQPSDETALDADVRLMSALGVDEARYRPWREGLNVLPPPMPAAAPLDVQFYAEGAVAWRQRDLLTAEARFQQVLALPEAARSRRGLWAQYMLARLNNRDEDYQGVIDAVTAGAPDPLGLGDAALGELAQLRLWREDWRGAVDLYLQQVGDGEPRGSNSLRIAAQRALDVGALDAWAADPVLAAVMSAWILAHGGPDTDPGELERSRAWLDAVEATGPSVAPAAERLAWMHAQVGDFDEAKAWLDRARPSPLASWLRGRLLVREGRLAEAEAALREAAMGFPRGEWWYEAQVPGREQLGGLRPADQAWGDVGLVRLARQDWTGALGAFVAADDWEDSAYTAERVLTLEEATRSLGALTPTEHTAARLRYLLARRALRLGLEVDPMDLPVELRADARRLMHARRRAATSLNPRDRARALWDEALLTRTRGIELMGTELDPDYAQEAGQYEVWPPTRDRFLQEGPAAPTAAEQARWTASAPEPDARFHYRYKAALLAQAASALLDDDDPDVLVLLCRADRWTRHRDTAFADAFIRDALRRTHQFPPLECGDPAFPAELGDLPAALALALSLGGLLMWAGGRRRATLTT